MKPDWIDEFIMWHESVIAQYLPSIQQELRRTRHQWLSSQKQNER